MTSQPTRIRDNLTKHERKALKQLQKRTDIVVKPADKGSGTVVLDYNWYVNECLRQLNDNKFYERQTKDLTNKIQERIKVYTSRLHSDEFIDDKTLKYLSSNTNPHAGRFYILPKIHKQGNPGRPIISSNGHLTEHISEFVDHHNSTALLGSSVEPLKDFVRYNFTIDCSVNACSRSSML